jgi:structure-specific endonuclease subunit SLX1
MDIQNNYMLYLLYHSVYKTTYLGITNNFRRRHRQHNGEIKGGARATTRLLKYGSWTPVLLVKNLTKSNALSLERIIKNKRRQGKGISALEKRIYLIKQIIAPGDKEIIYLL